MKAMITIDNNDKRLIKTMNSGESEESCFFKTKLSYLVSADVSDLESTVDLLGTEIKGAGYNFVVIEIKEYARLKDSFSIMVGKGDPSLTEKTINDLYNFLINWCKDLNDVANDWIDSFGGVSLITDGFYCLAHRSFSLITWALLDKYPDEYTWRDFGAIMFYTLFSPSIVNTKYKDKLLPKAYWAFLKGESRISRDIIVLNESENGELYCLFIWNSILEKFILLSFIYIEQDAKVVEVPLRLFAPVERHSFWSFSELLQSKEKNLNELIAKEALDFSDGYKKGRAYNFGVHWKDVQKYNIKELL
jgi:hypothetical protein